MMLDLLLGGDPVLVAEWNPYKLQRPRRGVISDNYPPRKSDRFTLWTCKFLLALASRVFFCFMGARGFAICPHQLVVYPQRRAPVVFKQSSRLRGFALRVLEVHGRDRCLAR